MSEMLHRVAHTPLRDIFRFRVTGRLDRAGMLEASGLPTEVRATITSVVGRTRLSRLEKADVTRELMAHFADAIQAGTPAAEAIARFGEIRTASKLIRRSKMRQRSLLWWAWRRTWQVAGAILLFVVGVYTVLSIRFVTGTPTVARDYLAELNAPALNAPETDRAWPLYREAKLIAAEPSKALTDAGWFSPEALADPQTLELARAYLTENEPAVELMRDAASRPMLGAVLSHEPDLELYPSDGESGDDSLFGASLVAVLMPQLGILRSHAKTLTAGALIAAIDGDVEGVMTDLDAIRATGVHCRDMPVLIADLVSLAILHLYLQTVGDLLDTNADLFSDEQLVSLGHAIAGSVSDEATRFDWTTERMMFDDMVQRAYTDNGAGDGRLVYEGLRNLLHVSQMGNEVIEPGPGTMALGPVAGAAGASRADLVRLADRVYAHAGRATDTPLWEWNKALLRSPVDDLDGVERIQYYPVVLFAPAFDRAAFSRQQVLQHRDAVLAAIALELYRRRHGDFPASLETLVPSLLPALPRDRFDGDVLKYRLQDGRPLLYSVGVNRHDDAGLPGERAPTWAWHDESMGVEGGPDDWILWPRDRN